MWEKEDLKHIHGVSPRQRSACLPENNTSVTTLKENKRIHTNRREQIGERGSRSIFMESALGRGVPACMTRLTTSP